MKSTRDGWGSEVYTVCGDAVAQLRRVMRCLRGCRDRICPGIQPTPVRYLSVPPFVRIQGVLLCSQRGFVRKAFVVVVVFAQLVHSGR